MADQAKEKPEQPAQRSEPQVATTPSASAGAGVSPAPETARRQQAAQRGASDTGSPPRAIQDAVPLPSVESDPLAEAARRFRELEAKSAGVTPMPLRAAQTGDVARDLLKDDGQISSLALSTSATSWRKPDASLPADMLGDGDNAGTRPTARAKPRVVKRSDSIVDVEARPIEPRPAATTLVDMDADLSLPLAPPAAPAAAVLVAETEMPKERSDADSAGIKPDKMDRVMALAAQAPILVAEPPAAPSEALPPDATAPEVTAPEAAASKLPPFPTIEREHRLPSGPSGTLRLFAGLSVVIAAFAGSLVWVAMWRADSFNSAEATIDISPEEMIQTSAGGNTATTLASTDNGGTATASLLVRDTELLLAKLAFDPGPADGVLDDTTREAIRRYQEAAGLPQTGEPSKELLDELQAVVAAIGGN
jgi:hypothetical protein